ncbi:MAG: RrF2 family transcriptional regulator [Clostridia bacterium]|nr:RrF2 family transcriptional regulator [Clostridia bacterium]NCC68919.1 RrF2 family transcriptional regulator [Clostridia bacterium]
MLVSTKGRYALRVMIDLAEHDDGGGYTVLMDIAERQEISEKYLEGILAKLSRAGFVSALRGRGGGYRLSRGPETYTVGSILKLTEGDLAPVSCLEGCENVCRRSAECRTLPMWVELGKLLDEFFEGITLADLIGKGGSPDSGEK